MEFRSLFRTAAPVAALLVLITAAGCDSAGSDDGGTETGGSGADAARAGSVSKVLQPLPAKIPADLRPYYEQKLRWTECDDAPGFDCTTLRVPMDYAEPDGGDLKLAVARKEAEDPGERLGSLHVNPGGPGASAIEFMENFAGIGYPADVRARYDIVAMDPRGVGSSQPVKCLTDKEFEAHTQVDQTPDDEGEVEALTASFDRFAQGCAKRAGDLLGHVSTEEAARDMDVFRGVLGDKKLTYVGASYGTMLGATYAGLFPQRAGRLVLDGAMDPSLTSRQLNLDQNAGFTTAFDSFAEDCVQRSDCPLGTGSAEEAGAQLRDFLDRLDAKPVPTGEQRKLGEPLATMGVLMAMYQEDFWPQLRDSLTDAMERKDGSGLLALADMYFEREPDGSYGSMMYGFAAVNCIDQPPPFETPADVEKLVPDFEADSPVFGRDFAWAALNCADWPVTATGEANRIEAAGTDPILVVGTTRDPATPYVWAESLAAQLEEGVLLTYEGDGHTAYARGNGCIDDAVGTYLLEGTPPQDGKRCR
ncbi:proteinase [Streptomyces sp. WAC 06738]|uniref:alpha/beta hydrolase n=1 Tax=Streptomyces sp. WAC 06738 TaxID=2203210 RepID=UPI000F6CEADF|nr:alpha/beta hydrolase [Streptomyces sp. WAC 06738]AZM46964.1 proteinase [Streptomyces sp. WAC 06738]